MSHPEDSVPQPSTQSYLLWFVHPSLYFGAVDADVAYMAEHPSLNPFSSCGSHKFKKGGALSSPSTIVHTRVGQQGGSRRRRRQRKEEVEDGESRGRRGWRKEAVEEGGGGGRRKQKKEEGESWRNFVLFVNSKYLL